MNPDEDPLQILRSTFLDAPQDAAATTERAREMADRLAESLSQLPAHVQFRGRPASEVECAAMLEALAMFEQLAATAGLRQRYNDLIQRCRLHYTAYRQYRGAADRPPSYADFNPEP